MGYFQESLFIGRETKNHEIIAVTLTNIASIYDLQGHYAKALKNYSTAIKIYEKHKFKTLHTLTVLGNMALVHKNLGQYLLGSTAPDIRVITKKPRSQYHFVNLDFSSVGDGLKAFYDAYPQLCDTAGLPSEQVAMIAGYLSHLVADETWITKMYRSYFNENQLFQSKLEAKLFDRVAQLTMDRKSKTLIQSLTKKMSREFNVFDIATISYSEMLEWKHIAHNEYSKRNP